VHPFCYTTKLSRFTNPASIVTDRHSLFFVWNKVMDRILRSLNEHLSVMSALQQAIPLMYEVSQQVISALEKGGKVFFMGNGGSAADAQHLAAELIGRFKHERQALAGIALTTDTSVLTALSNDYDYSIIFSRQLEALCKPTDIVFGLTTSGNSKNVLKGMEAAKKIGAFTVGLTGASGGHLAELVDRCFHVPSENVARIQEAHIFIGHMICECVEDAYAQPSRADSEASCNLIAG
jgi:D-sedoheptulose 7-phosphate isomerase